MNFYESLPILDRFEQVADVRAYRDLPDDWHVMVSDIRGSTRAVEAGRYREVNMAGASTISCLLNMVQPAQLPFVFGGDGATICIPGELVEKVRPGLAGLRRSVRAGLGFDMRVGIVPVSKIRAAGQQVKIARFRVSDQFVQAVFLGGGLTAAENIIKDPVAGADYLVDDATPHIEPNLAGLECRWHTIPSKHGETLAVLVKVLKSDAAHESEVYSRVLAKFRELFGDDPEWHPVHEAGMLLSLDNQRLNTEINLHFAGLGFMGKLIQHVRLRAIVLLGRWLMYRGIYFNNTQWGRYKADVIANTDHRKFDEMIRCVVACGAAQREALMEFLTGLSDQGLICFGVHVAQSATMTCYIREYGGQHFHFIDASGGGYTMAARQLKSQLAAAKGRRLDGPEIQTG
jgi:hypothetical protein